MRFAVLLSLTGLLPGLAQTPPASPAPDPARMVAHDCSADGTVVNAITGAPVPRARVSLLSAGAQTTSLADASGRFRMEKAPCGTIQVFARRAGFLENTTGLGGLNAERKPVILESGVAAHDIRVLLTPQAVVTGTVTDDQGDPVLGAQVAIFSSRVMQGRRTFQQTGQGGSNDLGEYRISGLAAGKYVVCAHLNPGAAPFDLANGTTTGDKCFPGPLEANATTTFELAAGREMRTSLSLPSVPSVHVRGTVTGLPRARGVALSLSRRGAVGTTSNRSSPVRPDGRFDISGVTPGAWLLATDYWEDNRRYTARIPLDIGGADVEGLTVALSEGFTLQGRVRVESKDGVPPPRNQFGVSLRSAEPIAGGGRVVWGFDGTTFTLADLTPGVYRLEAFTVGSFHIRRAMYNGRDISREDVPITQASGSIELVLSDESGSLEGQLEDREGKPAAGWAMLLEAGRSPRNARSDETGRFRFPSLAPGNYTIYAWDDFNQVEYANPEWMRRYAEGTRLTVEVGQTSRIKLTLKQAPPQ